MNKLLALVKFSVVGAGSTALHIFSVWALLTFTEITVATANIYAFCIATVFSYLLNTSWSFSSTRSMERFKRFIMVAVFGLCLTATVSLVSQAMNLSALVNTALVIVTVTPVSFLLHRNFTYSDNNQLAR